MPSTTTTTKKPIDGPCAACNKEGAILRCAPCRDAGVDVFFCNRECQVKQWKIHKVVCKKVATTKPKKEPSSAKKEVKQKGKKDRKYTNTCENCLKTFDDVGSKLSVCSKCKISSYCSRECQVSHWPKHESMCKHNCEFEKNIQRSFDSREMNIYNLLKKWLEQRRTLTCLSKAVYLALKKKGIEQQPPVKAAILEVEFNYNAQTFVVAEEPRAVAIADLSQEDKEMFRKILNESVEGKIQGYIHFVIISTKELGERSELKISKLITKTALDEMNADDVDIHNLRIGCAHVHLKSHLFRGWKSFGRSNLQKQMEQMNLGKSYTAFIQNALLSFCNESLQNTHRIIIKVKMGKEIGQILKLLDYKLWPIVEFKKYKEAVKRIGTYVEDTESRSPPCTDIAIETLFTDFDICFAFEYTVLCGDGMPNKTAKQCNKATEKHFRKLQQSVQEMQSDLLEKVSL